MASQYGMRGNGSSGASTDTGSFPWDSLYSFTTPINDMSFLAISLQMWWIILSWTPITSSSSIHAPSMSNDTNSFRCL